MVAAVARQSRLIAVVAAVLAAGALALLLVRGGGSPYTIHAIFVDAGQLVKGGSVAVGGRSIGRISDITLTDDGLADLALEIKDRKFVPLHRGTIATVRQLGLAGVTNRFVELSPGPRSASEIPDGGVLDTSETRPIVDLDALLNALDPATRRRLQGFLKSGAKTFDGPPSPQDANRAFRYLNPALSQGRAFAEELLLDEAALERLLQTSATVVTVFAGRRADVAEGIDNTRTTLRALAAERVALQDILRRSPSTIRRTRATLTRVREVLPNVRPALREAQPVAKPLAQTLRLLPPTVQEATPVVEDLNELLPYLRRAVNEVPGLERDALPTVRSLTDTLNDLEPIATGLRPYANDLLHGLLIGFGGAGSGYYDANGPYGRVSFHGATEQMLSIPPVAAILAILFPGADFGDLTGYRTGLRKRCPGAATQPAPDGSNPWRPDAARCRAEEDPHGD